jgi:hypothetical protein
MFFVSYSPRKISHRQKHKDKRLHKGDKRAEKHADQRHEQWDKHEEYAGDEVVSHDVAKKSQPQ